MAKPVAADTERWDEVRELMKLREHDSWPTINRILLRSGQVTPDPSKRPKSCLAGTGRQGGRNAFEQQLVVRTKRVLSPPVGAG